MQSGFTEIVLSLNPFLPHIQKLKAMTGILFALLESQTDQAALIRFDTEKVVRSDLDRFFGINVNALRDNDSNRPAARPLKRALAELAVKWMRYPGGEKSDFIRWSTPPYETSRPTPLGWYASVPGMRLDFDAFIALARSQGAQPLVVVGYDSVARSGLTEDEYLQDAVALVRYANNVKNYGVKRWEIGNENWHNQTATSAEMVRVIRRFSAAMKAVDPTILVGSSGNSISWNDGILGGAADSLDFLTVSQYIGWEWGSFKAFQTDTEPNLLGSVSSAAGSIEKLSSSADRGRLRIIVSETNTKDYSPKGWPDANDIGHALTTFVGLGRMALQPRVEAAMVWNTRWVQDDEARASMFYALDSANELTCTGQALKMWGGHVRPLLIETSCSSPTIATFSAASADGRELSLWAVNRSSSPQTAALKESGGQTFEAIGWTRLAGISPDDTAAQIKSGGRLTGQSFTLPPTSITCFTLKRTGR